MIAGRRKIYDEVVSDIGRVDPTFAKDLTDDGLDNASFLAAHRYATDGREIDAFLAAQPTIAEALAQLNDAVAHHSDVHRILIGSPVPVP